MKIRNIMLSLLLLSPVAAGANPIGRAEARVIAEEFVGIDDNSEDDEVLSPYYIFSRGKGKGYVIVSGDDTTAPIIGYTDEGDFDQDALPIQLKQMLSTWKSRVNDLQAKSPQARKLVKRSKAQMRKAAQSRLLAARQGIDGYKSAWADVPYLVKTKWSQGGPYNYLCPVDDDGNRTVTGCLATAGSQIAYYFRRDNPDTLIYDTPTYGYGVPVTRSLPHGTAINYNIMPLQGHGTAKQDTAVATLMYAMGTSSYLQYGSSTGGQDYNTSSALANQFMLSNDCVYKSSYTQQNWETLVYSSLKTKRPMLYTGYNENDGGHAVILDGYQASTGLYHFNFGWGGTGDGWYTIDDQTGMNGFNSYQSACVNTTPKKQKLIGTLETDTMLYQRAQTQVKAHVKNMGTLDYSGFKLYTNTKPTMPSKATVEESEVTLAYGDTAIISFPFTSSRTVPVYFFLTDKNGNLLDSVSVSVKQSIAALSLNSISVDAGQTTNEVDGITFKQVNNTTARVSVNLTNGEGGTYCQPYITCELDTYNAETKEWTRATTQTIMDLIFHEGETRDTLFAFSDLKPGTYYRAKMNNRVKAGVTGTLQLNTNDSIVYFTVADADLQMATEGRTAVVTGTWNANIFSQFEADSTICTYDMTGVTQLTEKPEVPNPNAVFYANNDIEDATNIIVNNVCRELKIATGYEFQPTKAFKATKATLILSEAEVGLWGDALVPFAAEAPYGVQVKHVDSIAKRAVELSTLRKIPAMTPILYLIDSDTRNTITAENVEISDQTDIALYDSMLTASTLRRTLEQSGSIFKAKNDLPYYLSTAAGTVVEPFRTVINQAKATGFMAFETPVQKDNYYRELADSINAAYHLINDFETQAMQADIDKLLEELKVAEDLFTYQTAETYDNIYEEIKRLSEAMQAFRDAMTTGIQLFDAQENNNSGAEEYYNVVGVKANKLTKGIVIQKKNGKTLKIYNKK